MIGDGLNINTFNKKFAQRDENNTIKANTKVYTLNKFFDLKLARKDVFFNCFLPDGTLTYICPKTKVMLNGKVGINFIKLLPSHERSRIKRLLRSLNSGTPIKSHVEDVITNNETIKIRWVNRAIFDAIGVIVEIESVGWQVSAKSFMQKSDDLRQGVLF